MSDSDHSWRYWSIDMPGLSRSSAQELLHIAEREGISTIGTLVDPAQFLTLHMDRRTVEAVSAKLIHGRSSEQSSDESDRFIVNGFRELLEDWLREIKDD